MVSFSSFCYCNKLPSTQQIKKTAHTLKKKNRTHLFYYSSGDWKSGMSLRGLNSWYQQLIPSRDSRREPISLSFLSPRGCLHSLARGASLHPQSQNLLFLIVLPIASVVTWPASHFTPCCPSLEMTVITGSGPAGSARIISPSPDP